MENVPDRVMANAELASYAALSTTRAREFSNESNLGSVQPRYANLLPARLSAFLKLVVYVVPIRAKEKMVEANAKFNITAVQNVKAVAWPYKLIVGELVRAHRVAIDFDVAVAAMVWLASPKPATVNLYAPCNSQPKAEHAATLNRAVIASAYAALAMSGDASASLVKSILRFRCFARKAELLYNVISHDLNLLNDRFKLWLGPLKGSDPLCGPFCILPQTAEAVFV